jgi:DNA-binding MarR family transcriptional regulator
MASVGGGPALFRLVRFWSRRWARGVAGDVGEQLSLPQHVMALEAVDACTGADGATVGEVARQLGLDHSGASRMVAAVEAAGLVERSRSFSDGRRSAVRITRTGFQLLETSRHWQQRMFDELTDGWSDRDRRQFAGYLDRLASQVGA